MEKLLKELEDEGCEVVFGCKEKEKKNMSEANKKIKRE